MRIQLHGRFTIEIGGHAVDQQLPGRRGRLLVAYLASHSHTPAERGSLIDLLWLPGQPGPGAAASFAALLSKTRRVLAPAEIAGRASLQLLLPTDTLVDADRATAALHDAHGATAVGDWRRAWTQALSAVFITQREFLPEFDADWVHQLRARSRRLHQDATACYAQACLELGGAELPSAERCARRLIDTDPLAERGYHLLMRALAGSGDHGAALQVYQQLRGTLREELGASPSPTLAALHVRLLRGGQPG